MKIKRGWSLDYGKFRFDVEVDETDLLRILAELGASDPAKVSASMTAIDVYLVMDHEAQAFTHHSLAKSEPDKSADHYAAATTHISQRNAVIAKYGISVPAE
jgi:hypothetical protein